MNNAKEVLDGVMEHAQRNYEQGGWDFLVECWTSNDILAKIEQNNLDTEAKAIEWFGRIVGLLDERRREVEAEIF